MHSPAMVDILYYVSDIAYLDCPGTLAHPPKDKPVKVKLAKDPKAHQAAIDRKKNTETYI